ADVAGRASLDPGYSKTAARVERQRTPGWRRSLTHGSRISRSLSSGRPEARPSGSIRAAGFVKLTGAQAKMKSALGRFARAQLITIAKYSHIFPRCQGQKMQNRKPSR